MKLSSKYLTSETTHIFQHSLNCSKHIWTTRNASFSHMNLCCIHANKNGMMSGRECDGLESNMVPLLLCWCYTSSDQCARTLSCRASSFWPLTLNLCCTFTLYFPKIHLKTTLPFKLRSPRVKKYVKQKPATLSYLYQNHLFLNLHIPSPAVLAVFWVDVLVLPLSYLHPKYLHLHWMMLCHCHLGHTHCQWLRSRCHSGNHWWHVKRL